MLVCFVSCAALAQERDVQRALQQRQQQSDDFALQLRQSQQRLQLVPGDLNQQQYLESQQLGERQRLENFDAQQQRSIGQGPRGIAQLNQDRRVELQRPYELRLPPPQVREPITPRPKERDPYFPSYTN
jgi:hypothetical protein